MKSEAQMRRYLNILQRISDGVSIYKMGVLKWILEETEYPTEKDLSILEELHKNDS